MKKIDKYMIATKAIHKMGDISREMEETQEHLENLCRVSEEDEENYYGMWTTGIGFFGVKFPKETTRELTQEEIDLCNTKSVGINNQPGFKLKVD
jgi:hypothetical protein